MSREIQYLWSAWRINNKEDAPVDTIVVQCALCKDYYAIPKDLFPIVYNYKDKDTGEDIYHCEHCIIECNSWQLYQAEERLDKIEEYCDCLYDDCEDDDEIPQVDISEELPKSDDPEEVINQALCK